MLLDMAAACISLLIPPSSKQCQSQRPHSKRLVPFLIPLDVFIINQYLSPGHWRNRIFIAMQLLLLYKKNLKVDYKLRVRLGQYNVK